MTIYTPFENEGGISINENFEQNTAKIIDIIILKLVYKSNTEINSFIYNARNELAINIKKHLLAENHFVNVN